MLLAVWSPKGGSGTSVVAASLALVLARSTGARLADLAGDQPALLGLSVTPATGLADWMAAGSGAPDEAIDRLAVDAGPGLALLARGSAPLDSDDGDDAATRLGRLLRDSGPPTVADLGDAGAGPALALAEAADAVVMVLRPCYLALRRAVDDPLTSRAAGIALVEEPGRALHASDVASVLSLPVMARFPVRPSVSRAVDAGLLGARLPETLARPATELLDRLGAPRRGHGEAA